MSILANDVPRYFAFDALYLDSLSSVIHSWMGNEKYLLTTREKLQLSPPQKLPVFFCIPLVRGTLPPSYPCLHFEFRSGGKSLSPPFELSFGGDEFWAISDARSPSILSEDFIRNSPKFISTKWKFKWWKWTFASTSNFEVETRIYEIVSWCSMCQSSGFPTVLTPFSRFRQLIRLCPLHSPFGMYIQNLELRGMELATKFYNWIRRSSWEYRYFYSQIIK